MLNKTMFPVQVPTPPPTELPVSITVQSSNLAAGNAFLIGSQKAIQLFSPTSGGMYNWSTPNATLSSQSCWSAEGPYLGVSASCLTAGGTYVFGLHAGTGGIYGSTAVRRFSLPRPTELVGSLTRKSSYPLALGSHSRRPPSKWHELHGHAYSRQSPDHRLPAAVSRMGSWRGSACPPELPVSSDQVRRCPHSLGDAQLIGRDCKPHVLCMTIGSSTML
jgi:hypothetical protein